MAVYVTARNWNDSLAIRIPKRYARARNIRVGRTLDLDSLRIVLPRRRRYKLSELMAQYKPQHRRGEWELGDPAGGEVW